MPKYVNFIFYILTGDGMENMPLGSRMYSFVWVLNRTFVPERVRRAPSRHFSAIPSRRTVWPPPTKSVWRRPGRHGGALHGAKDLSLGSIVRYRYCRKERTTWIARSDEGQESKRKYWKEERFFRVQAVGTECSGVSMLSTSRTKPDLQRPSQKGGTHEETCVPEIMLVK